MLTSFALRDEHALHAHDATIASGGDPVVVVEGELDAGARARVRLALEEVLDVTGPQPLPFVAVRALDAPEFGDLVSLAGPNQEIFAAAPSTPHDLVAPHTRPSSSHAQPPRCCPVGVAHQ